MPLLPKANIFRRHKQILNGWYVFVVDYNSLILSTLRQYFTDEVMQNCHLYSKPRFRFVNGSHGNYSAKA
jgi:hypothetical protein